MKRYPAGSQKDRAFTSDDPAQSARKVLVNPERENTYSTKFAAAI